MPRYRFYNRRFASRAPEIKHHFWRLPASRRGKTRRRSTLGDAPGTRRFRHFAQARAEPPCGHSASNGFVLGRHAAGFGSIGHHVWCRSTFVGGSATAFSAEGGSASSSPLTPLTGDRAERKAPGCLSSEPVPTGARQCDRPLRAPRCLPSSETRASALSRFVGRASFAGRRIRRCTCSSMFENVD